jgi:hypothetical protein
MATSDSSLLQRLGNSHSPRRTRSRTKLQVPNASISTPAETPVQPRLTAYESSNRSTKPRSVRLLPSNLSKTDTALSSADHSLLLRKERWLRNSPITVPGTRKSANRLSARIQATLVFAQEEAGTAVCISAQGYLLTCSHCVAETVEDFDSAKSHWLLFASGRVVEAKCVAWDSKRDLALLQVISVQSSSVQSSTDSDLSVNSSKSFPFVALAASNPRLNTALACIGHPGSEDLESSLPGVKTNYDVLHVSTGSFRGYAKEQDLQDNSEIGALQHDCWTYWGHSGAPLIEQRTGRLIGLHSSWDDTSGMRRGIPFEAIQEFMQLQENLQQCWLAEEP